MAMSKLAVYAKKYPLVPSMLTYSILYPSANIVQQHFFRESTKQTGIDWKEVSRYKVIIHSLTESFDLISLHN